MNTTLPPAEIRIAIRRDTDIVLACQKGRALAAQAGLAENDQVVVVIAISEVTHNMLKYAGGGEICLGYLPGPPRGLSILARDTGPGIANVEWAVQDGTSSGRSLGLGLPGIKRLMDDVTIASTPGQGTSITMKKWNNGQS